MKAPRITRRSAIVAAHPDDEVLWFSSILDRVGKTLICFQDVPSRPDWSRGRLKSLERYPGKNMTCLGLTESEVFAGAAWPDPQPTPHGLEVKPYPGGTSGFSIERYKQNFESLRTRLRDHLAGCRDVFTHNPWGEYGHEEHVQVFRAVESISQELGFRLWFSNYFSNKSHGLMLRHMAALDADRFSLKTRPDLGRRLQSHYSRNGCWTWYTDYAWPDTETFILWKGTPEAAAAGGMVVPMNAIRVEFGANTAAARSWKNLPRRALRKAKSLMGPRTPVAS
jgi:LmbE family N-acetylglucosaminyl deacetylase